MNRFGTVSDEEVKLKHVNYTPDNTKKQNKMAAEILRNYLVEKDKNPDFESYSDTELGSVLCTFYLDARTKKGDMYKTSSLENIRHSLNRYLKAPPVCRDIDIITDEQFKKSNESYKTALRELKQMGKGSTTHHPHISKTDLARMYMSVHLSPTTPVGLQNRCQMNVRLYFCRRANENMEKMLKSTFRLSHYENGDMYIYKAEDEQSKNHKENDRDLITGHMPADNINTDNCPVRTFLKYISKLNPRSERLWQHPKDQYNEDDQIWYQNRPMGRDALSKFMQKMSSACKLSQMYTNHSVRVTGATILSKSCFSAPQIMAVTGHKSTSSLAVYQR